MSLSTRPNNLSLVCLYLSLYIFFLLFGHFFLTHSVCQKKKKKKTNVQIIKRKYIHFVMTNIDTQETDYSV